MRQLNYEFSVPDAEISLLGSAAQPYLPNTNTNTGFQNVLVSGNYAYVIGTGGNGAGIQGLTLTIYNVQNPTAPFIEGYITTGTVIWTSGSPFLNGGYSLALNGQYLYIFSSGSSKFYVVNVSNPQNPFNVSGLSITGSPGSLYGGAYSNGYVYISTQNSGLTVVNVSNPLALTQTFQEGGITNKGIGVTVANGYVYTTNYQTTAPWTVRYLKIWSLANPAAPTLIETYTLPAGTKPANVEVIGNYAYVADLNTSSVQIINISNPLAPFYVASLQATNSFNVANEVAIGAFSISGNYAYLGSGGNPTYGGSIDFFDITNPAAPIKLSTYQEGVPGSVFGTVVLYNNLLYVADYGIAGGQHGSLNIYSSKTAIVPNIPVQNLYAISAQISNVPSTAAGTYELIASNDDFYSYPFTPVNYDAIPGTTGTISGTNVYLIPKTDLSYQNVSFAYTNTGSGGFNIILKALGF